MEKNGISTEKKLAILGGDPAFAEPLHVGCPNIGNTEVLHDRLNDIYERKWLTNNGKYVQRFEREIESLTGAKHCIAMTNGTIALEILIRALDLSGEVIVPSFTFAATPHALQWHGITPVFCDIKPETHNIDPSRVEALITPNTSGIIGVHIWGRPCDNDQLSAIAKKHDLKIMYDAAHAFGCSYQDIMIGNLGEAEIFSFHATKFLNTFEGGAVVTNNDELAEKVRLLQNFGFGPGYDNVICVGTNGKMHEVSAAMGITSLESMEDFIRVNRNNYFLYKVGLSEIPGIKIISYDEYQRNNFQYIVIEVDKAEFGLSRDTLIDALHAENIIARRYFHPGCHKMQPYKTLYADVNAKLLETETLTSKVVCLPTGTSVSESQIKEICSIIHKCISNSDVINRRFT